MSIDISFKREEELKELVRLACEDHLDEIYEYFVCEVLDEEISEEDLKYIKVLNTYVVVREG